MKKAVAGIFLSIIIGTSIVSSQPSGNDALKKSGSSTVYIDVASTSTFKINAVLRAFERVFGCGNVHVNKHKTASHISEQPVGELAGIQGALNRLNELPQHSSVIWAVAIESYIQFFPNTNSWQDIGCIVLLNRQKSSKTIFFTQPTPIPTEYVEMAQSESQDIDATGYSVTAGEMIHKHFAEIPKDNWHAHTLFGGISRDTLIQEAIYDMLKCAN